MAAIGAHLRSPNDSTMASTNGPSRLSIMQAKLREKIMVEKESRLLEMAARQEAAREGTIQRVTRSSASSLSSSLSSLSSSGAGQGRVRKMFEERRNNGYGSYNNSPVGWDKSYPLEPVGRNGGRPPIKGIVRGSRGISNDRGLGRQEVSNMTRSKSQAALQRANRGDARSPARGHKLNQERQVSHHKSTSSLLDTNQNYNGRRNSTSSAYSQDASPTSSPAPSQRNRFGFKSVASRGPSPAPPSNHTSSFEAPAAPPRSQGLRKPEDETDGGWRRGNQRKPQERRRSEGYLSKKDSFSASDDGYNEAVNGSNHLFIPVQHQSKPNGLRSRQPSLNQPSTRSRESSIRSNSPPLNPRTKKIIGKSKPPEQPKRKSILSQPQGDLKQCNICGRNFAPDRIGKHEEICSKSQSKNQKKKVFDPVKMRTKGTEAEKFVARGLHLKETKQKKKKDWRKEHEEFIRTVRAAKGIKGYARAAVDTSDYVQCPHCGRKFDEAVADRHIPKCASISSNKPSNKPVKPTKPPRVGAGRRR